MVPKNGNPKTVQLKNKYAKIKAHNLFKKRCYQNGNMFFQKNGSQNGSPQTFKKKTRFPKWEVIFSKKGFKTNVENKRLAMSRGNIWNHNLTFWLPTTRRDDGNTNHMSKTETIFI